MSRGVLVVSTCWGLLQVSSWARTGTLLNVLQCVGFPWQKIIPHKMSTVLRSENWALI